jgi:hypothetical protein
MIIIVLIIQLAASQDWLHPLVAQTATCCTHWWDKQAAYHHPENKALIFTNQCKIHPTMIQLKAARP